jgi:hypothetical protein
MSFTTVPVEITGASYPSISRPLSSQETRNFYQEVNKGGKDQFTLMSFPGLTLFGVGEGKDRGVHEMAEVLYRVADTTLYRVDINGVHTEVGSIPGSGRAIMADDGENLFIVSELKVWVYNGSTVAQVTDVNINGAKSVAFINNTFLYTKDKFTTVSTTGDGTTASGLDIIGAESDPDDLVRDYVFKQSIYRMGERTIEVWYFSGSGRPPIERLEGQIFQVGLAAIHSPAQTDNAMYWLGDDRRVYLANGGTIIEVTNLAIAAEMQTYSKVDDAVGFTFTIQGQNFYAITFPSEGKTWVMNESLQADGWFQLASGTDGSIYPCSSLQWIYGKNILADAITGDLYELDFNNYTLNGEVFQRRRVTGTVDGNTLGVRGSRVQMSRIELIMETGIGLINGQGENPQIMIEISLDGGKTWKHGKFARVGRLGETMIRVEYFGLHTFYEMCMRLTTSDPVPYYIYNGSVDLRLAGR